MSLDELMKETDGIAEKLAEAKETAEKIRPEIFRLNLQQKQNTSAHDQLVGEKDKKQEDLDKAVKFVEGIVGRFKDDPEASDSSDQSVTLKGKQTILPSEYQELSALGLLDEKTDPEQIEKAKERVDILEKSSDEEHQEKGEKIRKSLLAKEKNIAAELSDRLDTFKEEREEEIKGIEDEVKGLTEENEEIAKKIKSLLRKKDVKDAYAQLCKELGSEQEEAERLIKTMNKIKSWVKVMEEKHEKFSDTAEETLDANRREDDPDLKVEGTDIIDKIIRMGTRESRQKIIQSVADRIGREIISTGQKDNENKLAKFIELVPWIGDEKAKTYFVGSQSIVFGNGVDVDKEIEKAVQFGLIEKEDAQVLREKAVRLKEENKVIHAILTSKLPKTQGDGNEISQTILEYLKTNALKQKPASK